ncbi:exodeoxyribonuclease VII large subunit [Haloferula luteola]|uniref:Exodeoxyribonuclease 7 large subunit n=1 Tax=Haloferula luteola TaxID=595692 RepID=A0A840V6P2_9BACT|nr:exodeoxyribonuclease VII large subunit [Haloferula luteola]MBB5351284.1 exodeoxyribonuclease VII large subunit [Haloferula luteola]
MIPVVDLFSSKSSREPQALSVTQLVRRMKNLLEIQLGEQWVEGEVSNLRKQGSGHWYFSLKDEGAQISCVMFGARRKAGSEALEDGAKVRVFAEPSVYEARGQLQIIVQKVERAGLGDLQARFEALKRKLEAEGLFAAERKQELPAFPRVVGLVTSATGAAIEDILNVMGRRAPWVKPVLFPVRVQGKGAEKEIAEAIRRMGEPERFGLPRCDLLIVGRGGGSLEDLWNFNEEVVARAIAACPIPVLSAVGHEIDFTIADFVADRRAPTPSAAAEMAVPDGEALRQRIEGLERRLKRRVSERIERLELVLENARRGVLSRGGDRLLREPEMRLDGLRYRLVRQVVARWRQQRAELKALDLRLAVMKPERQVTQRRELLEGLRRRIDRAARVQLEDRAAQVSHLGGLLKALGPQSAFDRGFSITLGPDGKVVHSVHSVQPGEVIQTKVSDGDIHSCVQAS